ncbi:MAG TPA: hypothetical protein VKU41_27490 [Polyangiaceae bacterium]|nr:hypothetical protein [Polyangiaceae bacterium]
MGDKTRPLVVRHGRLLGYRLLDVADEIDLAHAQTLVEANASRRGAMTHEGARSLVLAAQPLDIPLGTRSFRLPRVGATLNAEVSAHLFQYGAVSIAFEVPIVEGTALGDLVALCDEIYETPELDRLARDMVAPLLARLLPAVRGRHDWEGIEEYTVVYVQRFDGDPPASDVLSSPVLASLVVGEPPSRRLSHGERQDVLKHAHSYFDDDLVVVDWNSAFVLEPSGSRDIPDLLEIATSQLLELRYYDGLFDRELARVYRELELARRGGLAYVVQNPWVDLGRRVVRELVELSEFAERIDNALKIIGDFYLARVYESAVRRFRIRSWQSSIDAKQALLAQAYGLVRGEIESRRSTVLELVVIALIVLEVILALVRK